VELKWRPRQDSNLRHRLRRPIRVFQTVQLMIRGSSEQRLQSRGQIGVFSVVLISLPIWIAKVGQPIRLTSALASVCLPTYGTFRAARSRGAGGTLECLGPLWTKIAVPPHCDVDLTQIRSAQ
jgi:hypothetical protein